MYLLLVSDTIFANEGNKRWWYENNYSLSGADPKFCGNYLDQNVVMAKYWANKFYNEALTYPN